MRPHFIYNALMSIYYLCAQKPQKVQEVTLDFMTYLRKNFTALAGEDTISFSDELEHTRAYLLIEQVQFEDNLLVDFDTPHKNFRVPSLILQPIVENVIEHGINPESAPLRIFIRTRKINFESEIMCGGKLIIRLREEGGAVVKVIALEPQRPLSSRNWST